MATPGQVQQIRSVVDALTMTPIDALISNQQKWGAINFEMARRDLAAMFGLGRHIKELAMDIVSDGIVDDFLQSFTQANAVVQTIAIFTIESGDATGRRDEIVAQVHQVAQQLLKTAKAMYKEGALRR